MAALSPIERLLGELGIDDPLHNKRQALLALTNNTDTLKALVEAMDIATFPGGPNHTFSNDEVWLLFNWMRDWELKQELKQEIKQSARCFPL